MIGTTSKRVQRRAERRERERGEILDVALGAFADRGYDGALMTDIASQSGYSVGHIYNVVGTKDELFDAVMIREGEMLAAVFEHALSGRGSAARRIDRLIDDVLRFFDVHRSFFQIYLNESGAIRANVEYAFAPALVAIKNRLDRQVRSLVTEAKAEGTTAPLSPSDMATALSELINGFVGAWAAGGYRGRISAKGKVIKHMLWNGIKR